jgi:hypothetical protein
VEHDTSSFTNIEDDGIIHMDHPADDENSANSHINSNSLIISTSEKKDKVGRKKKVSIKLKGESSPSVALVEKNENIGRQCLLKQSDSSRWEAELNKLISITGDIIMHPIYSL